MLVSSWSTSPPPNTSPSSGASGIWARWIASTGCCRLVDSGSIEIPTTSAPWATSLRLNAEKISSSPRLVDPIHPATAIRIRRRV